MHKHRISFIKGRLAIPLGLLASNLLLSTTVQAQCRLQIDPFLSKAMGHEVKAWLGHPCAQPEAGVSVRTDSADGLTSYITTPEGQHPPQDPFAEPPGSNFLMTVYQNLRDYSNREMPNTLPSTPDNPYNLHDGPVLTEQIDMTSPDDDLDEVIRRIEILSRKHRGHVLHRLHRLVRFGLDILEGNPINRTYSGLPMLHYTGATRIKEVVPSYDVDGNVIGGNVDINMYYWGQHIEADAMFIDPSAVQEVPWTITYHVNILHRGMEDFSPMVSHVNKIVDPASGKEITGPFHASMDQTFYPMLDEGTRYTIKIKQTKGKYFNLIYHWGWRIHPPRVQAIENALKVVGADRWTLPQWEKSAFCEGGAFDPDCDPVNDPEDKAYAIAQIGDLSPAKRMWNLFNELKGYGHLKKWRRAKARLRKIAWKLRGAYLDWVDRTKLPQGVSADPDATLTLLFVNNTLYANRQGRQGEGSGQGPASYKGISNGSVLDWNIRPYNFKVTVYNGDHFRHTYRNVDFGGSRGWENQFQYTDPTTLAGPHPEIPPGHDAGQEPFNDPANLIAGEENVFPINRGGTEEYLQPAGRNLLDPVNGAPQLGSGCFFTFGRNYLWPNAGGLSGLIFVPPVSEDGTPGMHKVEIAYNYEPSRRLRLYQFDPVHHGVAIYSLH